MYGIAERGKDIKKTDYYYYNNINIYILFL